ncbi:ROK family transcriptional regulator [Roseobacteraceae bacterium S113]
MRERNERLVLTILRRQGPLPKAEIARKTGLSAQTVSVIMRALEHDGLLEKGEKTRGKVGQPSVPMRLAREGAFFLGLKVGRRSAALVLLNFAGEDVAHVTRAYSYPTPQTTLEFVREAMDEICGDLSEAHRARIAGMGIAAPYFLWEWGNVIGVAPEEMAAWRTFDLRGAVAALCDFPVYLGNDATSACGAELTFGTADVPPDFLYIYIGYFVGGGVVLNGTLYPGRSGNAGAIGPFPVVTADGTPTQIVDKASLIGLERLFAARDGDAFVRMDPDGDWPEREPELVELWLSDAVPALSQLIVAACSIVDFPAILLDGNMPASLRETIVDRVTQALNTLPLSGLVRPDVIAGTLGPRARPMGAASLPLTKRFMLEA